MRQLENITIIWNISHILRVDPTLNNAQAAYVLEYLRANHDRDIGITNSLIEFTIESLRYSSGFVRLKVNEKYRPGKMTNKMWEQAIAMRNRYMRVTQIAHHFGVNRTTIGRGFRLRGIK